LLPLQAIRHHEPVSSSENVSFEQRKKSCPIYETNIINISTLVERTK